MILNAHVLKYVCDFRALHGTEKASAIHVVVIEHAVLWVIECILCIVTPRLLMWHGAVCCRNQKSAKHLDTNA